MIALDQHASVGLWVAERPELATLFDQLHIDYCCRGERSLEDACRESHLDVPTVLERIRAVQSQPASTAERAWLEEPLGALCDHIESTHHQFLRSRLPQLSSDLAKVVAAHGAAHPELSEVQRTFETLRAELESHMWKEERILFPAIRQMEPAGRKPAFPFGTVQNPIRVMEQEHDEAGDALERLRELTRGFQPPDDACATYRAVLNGLHELEGDLHRHIHKENSILFPRAQALEAGLA